MSWMSRARVILLGDDQQILGPATTAPDPGWRLAQVSNLLRLTCVIFVGHITLATDGQQQRMNAGRVDSMNRVHPGHDCGNQRPGQFVDNLAEPRVFLRRPAHDGEGPNGAGAMSHLLDAQYGKRMLQAVIAEVIAERPFRQGQVRLHDAADAKVGVGTGDRRVNP